MTAIPESATSAGGGLIRRCDFNVSGVRLENLQVRVGTRVLLQNVCTEFQQGQLTLILGYSGVGKSLLLRILAGLVPADHPTIHSSGTIRFGISNTLDLTSGSSAAESVAVNNSAFESGTGADRVSDPGLPPGETDCDVVNPVSVVFQNFALFDELTPAENIRIAVDHAAVDPAQKQTVSFADELLERLGVPSDRPVSVLSGGQQQRLAIARAIAPGTGVVLYDEPTSGLDAVTSARTAQLIRETHDRYQRTSVIVTHDYERLAPIADRVLLLDHRSGTLRELSAEELKAPLAVSGDPPEVEVGQLLGNAGGFRASELLVATGRFVEELLVLPLSILPRWKSVRWGMRWLGFYLRLVGGFSAVVYVATACMLLGYVAQDFVFRYLPYRQFSEPLLLENLLHATGFSLYRFLVPILATLLLAARSGAAVTANLGTKVYGGQLDALVSVGADPSRVLKIGVLISFIVAVPILSLLGYFVAAISAGLAFLLDHGELGVAFWDAHFHQNLVTAKSFFYAGTGWLLPKLILCGAGTGIISWLQGTAPKQSAAEISRAVTTAILWSTLYVLLVHFLFSLFEFVPQG